MSDIVHMSHALKAALFTPSEHGRWGEPVMSWGAPGTAKTEMTYQVAKRYRLPMAVEIAVLSDPTDYKGMPTPDQTLTYIKRLLDAKWETLIEAKNAIIFLDEIPHAPPAVQAALLRFVQERVLGDRVLPKGIRFLLAGNPVGTGAGGWDLLTSFANRLCHIDWPAPTPEAWTAWLISDGGENGDEAQSFDPEAEQARVMQLWPKAYAVARGELAGYMKSRPTFLHRQPKEGDPKGSRGWPSLRSWVKACRFRAARTVHSLNEITSDVLVEGCVGHEAAVDFRTWIEAADLPDFDKLLDGEDAFTHERSRSDRTAAVLAGCAARVTPKNAERRKERAAMCWRNIITPVARMEPDLAWPAAEALSRARLGATAWPEKDNPAQEALSALANLRDYLCNTK